MKLVRAVGAVVFRICAQGQIQVLLIRKRGGGWSLPKGKLKPGEDEVSAVLREIEEETGIVGEVIDLVGEARYPISKPDGVRSKVVTYYLVRALGGELHPSADEKIIRVRWVMVPRALRRLQRTRLSTLLRAALTLLGPTALDEPS